MRSKKVITNSLLILFSLCVAIFLSEIICRLVITRNISFEVSQARDLWIYDDKLGWINKPNTKYCYRNDLVGFNSNVTFDEYGIRSNDNPIMNVANKRILVIGDSATVGVEVDNNKTYVALLEAFYQNEGYNFKFYNAGVRGYGTDQCLLNLKRLHKMIQPDYVLYMFCSNDFGDNRTIKSAQKLFGKPAFIMDNEELRLANYPSKKYPRSYYAYIEYSSNSYDIKEGYTILKAKYIDRINDLLSRKMILFCLLRVAYHKYEDPMKMRPKTTIEKDLDVFSLILKGMTKVNKNLILTSIPRGDDVPHEKFVLIAKKLNIRYLNISPFFNKNGEYGSRFDAHWNEKGHLQAAKALHKMLKAILVINQ